MIVLHEHQLIFLKPTKVAGTSFEIALSHYAHEDDIITPIVPKDEELRASLGFRGPQNYQHTAWSLLQLRSRAAYRNLLTGRRPALYWNHIDAARAKSRLGSSNWNRYMKVTIVRNPWDRLISRYFYDNPGARFNFTEFSAWTVANETLLNQNHAQYMIGEETIIDFFIRYERFKQDIKKLESCKGSLSGLSQVFSAIRTKVNFRPKTEFSLGDIFYNSPAVDILIRKKNAFEIEKFGYDVM